MHWAIFCRSLPHFYLVKGVLVGIIEQASSYAAQIDNLILIVGVFVMFWFVLAQGIIFYFLFRYRKKRQPKAEYMSLAKNTQKQSLYTGLTGV